MPTGRAGAFLAAAIFAIATQAPAATDPGFGIGLHDGRVVEFRIVEGWAVVDGDILLGNAADLQAALAEVGTQAPAPKAFTISRTSMRWPKGASGAFEVPYTIESDPTGFVPTAVAIFNTLFPGFLQFVPRTIEQHYVAFALNLPPGSSACMSQLGRIGGKQMIVGPVNCAPAALLHEMGHAIGLVHEHQRNDRDLYVDWIAGNAAKLSRPQWTFKVTNRQIVGPYDYASVMHYDDFTFSVNGRPTTVTIPQGIEIGTLSPTYSAGDIDAVRRLYGAAPTTVTVTSHPPGLLVSVDGEVGPTPRTFDWTPDSVHTIDVPQPGQLMSTVPYFFARWNVDAAGDGVARRTIKVSPGLGTVGNPSGSPAVTLYNANFIRLFPFVASVHGDTAAAMNAITPSVVPPAQEYSGLEGSFFRANQPFTLDATVAPGYSFGGWYYDAVRAEREGPASQTWRVYAPAVGGITSVTAAARAGPILFIKGRGSDGVVDGFSITVNGAARITPYSSIYTVFGSGGTHRIGAATTQFRNGATARYLFSDWDGTPDNPISVTLPGSGEPSREIVANFRAQHLVNARSGAACAGTVTVTPSSADGFHDFGAQLSIGASPAAGWTFAGWKDDFAGSGPSKSITVTGEVFATAQFNATETPLTVTGTSRLLAVTGEPSFDVTIYGTGFTPQSFVAVNNVSRPATFIDASQLRVTLFESDYVVPGEVSLIVAHIRGGCIVADSTLVPVRAAGYALPPTVDVIEFYHAVLDHYFITVNPDEIAKLDNGTFKGWARTGRSFKAFPADSPAIATDVARAVCRFYGNPAAGLDSHFYSGDKTECDAVRRNFPGAWIFESAVVLQVVFPDRATGACPDATIAVYRLFNGRADANHMYTTDATVRAQMIARGYIPEGYGAEGVAMCAPV